MLVPAWASGEEFRRLEGLGLTMYGQMTAGSWIYIGSQGIVQGTFETFAAAGAREFGGDLAGRLVVTAGLGGMGGAQPLEGRDDRVERFPASRGAPGSAVDDQLVGLFGDVGIEVVLEHPEGGFLLPAPTP